MIGFYLAIVISMIAALFIGLSIELQTVPTMIRLRAYRSKGWRKGQIAYYLQIGTRSGPFTMGAGYIGGATAYFARRCVKPNWRDSRSLYRTVPVCFGLTTNGNTTPYVQG